MLHGIPLKGSLKDHGAIKAEINSFLLRILAVKNPEELKKLVDGIPPGINAFTAFLNALLGKFLGPGGPGGPPSPAVLAAGLAALKAHIGVLLNPQQADIEIDYGDPEIGMFKVDVYRTVGGGDVLLGSRVVTRNDTIKSVIDSIKGGNPNQRCIVSTYKSFLNSLGPKDYYATFNHLKLTRDQVELFLI